MGANVFSVEELSCVELRGREEEGRIGIGIEEEQKARGENKGRIEKSDLRLA